MPVVTCKVPGCTSTAAEDKLFCFPKSPRCDSWLKAINCPILNKIPKGLIRHQRICYKHFTLSSFASPRMNALNRNAVPTLKLPSLSSSNSSARTFSNITNESKLIDVHYVPCTKSTEISDDLLEKTPFTQSSPEAHAGSSKSIDSDYMLNINSAICDELPSCSVKVEPRFSMEPSTSDTSHSEENVIVLNASSNAGNIDPNSTSGSSDTIHQLRMELAKAKTYIKKLKQNSQLSKLRKELSSAKAYIRKLKATKQFPKLKQTAGASFVEYIDALNLSTPANVFLKAQLHQNRSAWSTEEKAVFLFLYKSSPKMYSLLESIFNVPSRRTLQRALKNVK